MILLYQVHYLFTKSCRVFLDHYIKAWCAKNGLKATTFHYWIKRFKALERKATPTKTQFAEVVPEACSASSTSENKNLCLSCGSYTIGIADGFNPDTLSELLKVKKGPVLHHKP